MLWQETEPAIALQAVFHVFRGPSIKIMPGRDPSVRAVEGMALSFGVFRQHINGGAVP